MATSSGNSDGRKEKPIQERFESAVGVIRSLPKDGPYQPSNMVKLKFYGLYKQAKEGPNTTPKPGFWDPTSRAKWEAWTLCGEMTKEAAMRMYIQELQQIVETMPQTKEVEKFLTDIGPFYELVEDKSKKDDSTMEKEQDNNEEVSDKEESDNDSSTTKLIKSSKRVTFGDKPVEIVKQEQEDSDSEVEFQDSFDNLPLSTPPTSSGYSRIQRRPTPYISQSGIPLGEILVHNSTGHEDSVSTNLFGSPSTTSNNNQVSLTQNTGSGFTEHQGMMAPSPGISEAGGQPLSSNEVLTQLAYNVQVLTQQLSNFLHQVQDLTQPSPALMVWRRPWRLLVLIVGPVVINIIFRYWSNNGTTPVPWWMWAIVTTCHVVCNIFALRQ